MSGGWWSQIAKARLGDVAGIWDSWWYLLILSAVAAAGILIIIQNYVPQTDEVVVLGPEDGTRRWILLDTEDATACTSDLVHLGSGATIAIDNIGKGVSCATEVTGFATGFAPALVRPTWTAGHDRVELPLLARWPIKLRVVGLYPEAETEAKAGADEANTLFEQNHAGLDVSVADVLLLNPAPATGPLDPLVGVIGGSCSNAAAVAAKPELAWPQHITVIYLRDADWRGATDATGRTCTLEGFPGIIYIRQGSDVRLLAHELGHSLSLMHMVFAIQTTWLPSNLMQDNAWGFGASPTTVDHLTLGQVYRMHFYKDSWLNTSGVRSGDTRTCQDSGGATSNEVTNWPCPRLGLEWP